MRFSAVFSIVAVALVLVSVQAAPAAAQGKAVSFVQSCKYDARAPRVGLSGRVKDPHGDPVVGANVTLRCGAFRRDVRTIGDGTYQVSVPAGAYQIDVSAPGLEPAVDTVHLSAPGPASKDFALASGTFGSIITVKEKGGFVAASSTSATKTDAPLIEIPQSVSVVTEDQLTTRNVQTVNQAIRYTGGVDVNTYGEETRYDWINIRGFDQSTYGLYRDNSRWQSGQVSGQIDPYMLQEVDIVKGPSSVLYGQNEPGGLVNLVTKRPPVRPLSEVVLNYGSFNRKQAQLDFGGPLDTNGAWRYRITGLWRKSDTQVDYVPNDRWFIAPALTWQPSSKTTLTILTDYQHDNTGWSQFLPSQGTLKPNPNGKIPTNRFVGEPNYDYFHRNQWSAGTLFQHQLSSHWSLRNTLRFSSIKYDGKDVFGGGLQSDLRTLNRFGFGNSLDYHLFTMDTNAYGRYTTGRVEHAILFGVDYSNSRSKTVSGFAFAPTLDIFHPVYGAPVPALFTYYNTTQPETLVGVYLQDHMKFGSRWVGTAALRHDTAKITTEDAIGGTTVKQKPSDVTGRVGLTYLTDSGFAPYITYSTSFLPVTGVNFYGKDFKPTKGKQIEGGLKFQPKGSDSFVTASLYQITESNVQVPDPTNPLNTLQQGEIRSRGVELEATGSLYDGLSYTASYSYLDQKVTKTTDLTALGKRPPLAPNSLASLFGDYVIHRGPLTGLGLGLGVRYVGSRAGDSANTIEIPSYTLLDASLRYLWRDTEFQLSATNLTNKTYVAVCTSPSYCNYGTTRQVLFTVRYDLH